jgi:hypothetical protein
MSDSGEAKPYNPNKYFIREADKVHIAEEVERKTIVHLIDQGKLKYVYKKFKRKKFTTQFENHSETEIRMETHRFYDRIDGEPQVKEICNKPCCAYTQRI